MKLLKYTGHPVLLISIFLFLLIEGSHFGGFYLQYILLALPHGGLYAILSVAGIAALLTGYKLSQQPIPLQVMLQVTGLMLMIFSLIAFFGNSAKSGVAESFNEPLPLFTFVLFGISIVCFALQTGNRLIHPYKDSAT